MSTVHGDSERPPHLPVGSRFSQPPNPSFESTGSEVPPHLPVGSLASSPLPIPRGLCHLWVCPMSTAYGDSGRPPHLPVGSRSFRLPNVPPTFLWALLGISPCLLYCQAPYASLLSDERLPKIFPDWPWRTILHQPKASQSPPPFSFFWLPDMWIVRAVSLHHQKIRPKWPFRSSPSFT
jgi:hypothetical protein